MLASPNMWTETISQSFLTSDIHKLNIKT